MRRTWMIALLLGLTFTAPAYAEVDAVTGATQVGAGTDKQARNDERVRKMQSVNLVKTAQKPLKRKMHITVR